MFSISLFSACKVSQDLTRRRGLGLYFCLLLFFVTLLCVGFFFLLSFFGLYLLFLVVKCCILIEILGYSSEHPRGPWKKWNRDPGELLSLRHLFPPSQGTLVVGGVLCSVHCGWLTLLPVCFPLPAAAAFVTVPPPRRKSPSCFPGENKPQK